MNEEAILQAIESLREDIRRSSRAALAAKAAAEEIARAPSDDTWARSLLPSLDTLDRCAENSKVLAAEYASSSVGWFWRRPADPRVAALSEAIRIARQILEDSLSARGYTLLRPERGELFDPERHRAVDTTTEVEPGRIAARIQSGLSKGARVLREAQVSVGRSRAIESHPQAEPSSSPNTPDREASS